MFLFNVEEIKPRTIKWVIQSYKGVAETKSEPRPRAYSLDISQKASF